jgi:hypothetical protein
VRFSSKRYSSEVEYLPSMLEALGLIPNTVRKKKKNLDKS